MSSTIELYNHELEKNDYILSRLSDLCALLDHAITGDYALKANERRKTRARTSDVDMVVSALDQGAKTRTDILRKLRWTDTGDRLGLALSELFEARRIGLQTAGNVRHYFVRRDAIRDRRA